MIKLSEKRVVIGVITGLMMLVIAGIFLSHTTTSQAKPALAPSFAEPDWSPFTHLSTTSTQSASNPIIAAAPNGNLLTIFTNGLTGKNLLYVQSTDAGETWSNPAPIHTSSANSQQVAVTFNSNNIAHAVWREDSAPNAILYANQNQWASNTSKIIISTPQLLFEPDIAASGNNILDVVWEQVELNSQRNIYHVRSTDGGNTWSTPNPLADDNQNSSHPVIAVDNAGNLHVLWEEETLRIVDGFPLDVVEIQYRKGTVSGGNINWSPASVLSPADINIVHRPVIRTQGAKLHVAFARQEGDLNNADFSAYYTKYEGSWSDPIDTTSNSPIGVNGTDPQVMIPALTICDGNIFIYYHGTFAQNENEGLYGANQADNWTRDQVTLLDARHINPSIACVNGQLHMAFERIVSNINDRQIYYINGVLERKAFLPILHR